MNVVTALPQLQLWLNGRPLSSAELLPLTELRVQQRLSMPALCELIFSELPAAPGIVERFEPGCRIELIVGDFSEPLFAGEVTAVEFVYGAAQQRELRVRAYDLLHRLRKRQRVRVHVQLTTAELARELTGDLGLDVWAAASDVVWPRLYQHNQSDLELLTETAERAGFYLVVRGSALELITLAGSGPPVPLRLGDELLEAQLEMNGDPAVRSVKATGWNPALAEAHNGAAGAPRVGRRVVAEVTPAQVGGDGTRLLIDTDAGDGPQAEALAQAEIDRQFGREVTLWGVAEGNPALRVGGVAEVAGVAAHLNGRYVLTSVSHILNAESGYVTEIDSTPPPPARRQRELNATLGIVTQIGDPQGAGRVKVALTAYNNVESDWLGVLTPGGGPGKGLVAMPDIDDTVLVLLMSGDPARALVLGGLYGRQGPPDTGVEGGAVARYTFRTPGGQKLTLDDAAGRICLETDRGSYVELMPDVMTLHAESDLILEAPGKRVTIRGDAVDFDRG